MMKNISIDAGLGELYTNHCIRATSVTNLDQSGFEARHIMSLSGHRSESSIRSYSKSGVATKRKMSNELSRFCEAPSFDFGVDVTPSKVKNVASDNFTIQNSQMSTENLSSFVGNSAKRVLFKHCVFNFNQK